MFPGRTRSTYRPMLLLLVSLSMVVLACGPGTSTSEIATATYTVPPTATATQATVNLPPSPLQNVAASVDLNNLHIQTSEGVQCADWIVLSDPKQSLDAGSLQQIRAYLNSVTGYFTDQPSIPASVNPEALQRATAPAALSPVMGSFNDTHDASSGQANGCTEGIEITNTGDTDVTITQIGITYASASTPNSFQYSLVDRCTVVQCGPCDGCGSAAGCSLFAAAILQPGPIETHYDYALQTTHPDVCPAGSPIPPGQIGGFDLDIGSAVSAQIYHLRLTLTVMTTQGTQTITLPDSFTSYAVFAQRSQFTCYALQGTTFVQESTPTPSCI